MDQHDWQDLGLMQLDSGLYLFIDLSREANRVEHEGALRTRYTRLLSTEWMDATFRRTIHMGAKSRVQRETTIRTEFLARISRRQFKALRDLFVL